MTMTTTPKDLPRQLHPNHAQQLLQNTTSNKRHDHHHKHLHGVPPRIVVDVPQQALDVADDALHEAGARPRPSRRGRGREDGWARAAAAVTAAAATPDTPEEGGR